MMYSTDETPAIYSFMPGIDKVINNPPKREFDLMFTVDISVVSRIGERKVSAKKLINIDHHLDNQRYGDINLIIEAASVGEILYDMAVEFGIPTLNVCN